MKIVTAEEMKIMDKEAEKYGISGLLLMDNAAKAVADTAAHMMEDISCPKVIVLCGRGNNGGDGFGAARWLLTYGIDAEVVLVGFRKEDVQGDAAAELNMFLKAGGRCRALLEDEEAELEEIRCRAADLIIDAMLGTGFHGQLSGLTARMCAAANSSRSQVLAVDVPTGVSAADGTAADNAVCADVTVTMSLVKTGLLLYPARDYAGCLICANIGMPENMIDSAPSRKYMLTDEIAGELLPVRRADAHKGDAGRVTICAGSPGFTGAAALCANAAVKAGAGLVTLMAPLSCRDILGMKLTEVMVQGLLERMPGILGGAAVSSVLQRANASDVLAVGPGLGTAENTQDVIREILLKAEVPAVIDADALNALSGHTDILSRMQAPKVLTPHPGEMARLTGMSIEEINSSRIETAEKYAAEWNAVVVLKGAPTVIACPDGNVYVNTTGCSAMATGGSGDVLTGIIAGLAAQGITLQEAAVCGVYLHGLAGEIASGGEIGLAAGEISACLPEARFALEDASKELTVYNMALKVIK